MITFEETSGRKWERGGLIKLFKILCKISRSEIT